MIVKDFFPDPAFGWAFIGVLGAFLAVASYRDLCFLLVPKWLTLPLAGVGLLFNLIRGGWLGAAGTKVWLFSEPGLLLGLVDGLLFSLAGFALGFALYFGMWMLNICGGGDVKLFAAVGAWIGKDLVIYVLMATIVVVFVIAISKVLINLVGAQLQLRFAMVAARSPSVPLGPGVRSRRQALGFSLPLAAATLFVMLWVFRFDLHLTAAPTAQAGARGEAHVRQTR